MHIMIRCDLTFGFKQLILWRPTPIWRIRLSPRRVCGLVIPYYPGLRLLLRRNPLKRCSVFDFALFTRNTCELLWLIMDHSVYAFVFCLCPTLLKAHHCRRRLRWYHPWLLENHSKGNQCGINIDLCCRFRIKSWWIVFTRTVRTLFLDAHPVARRIYVKTCFFQFIRDLFVSVHFASQHPQIVFEAWQVEFAWHGAVLYFLKCFCSIYETKE